MSSVTTTDPDDRMRSWRARLDGAGGAERVEAMNLYSGPQWAASLALLSLAENNVNAVGGWVASAGHGLIGITEKVPSYGATFAPGGVDYVGCDTSRWWSLLTNTDRTGSNPGSVAGLAATNPDFAILVAVSVPYLKAMIRDLVAASRIVGPDRVLISTAMSPSLRSSRSLSEVASSLLPVSARIRMLDRNAPKPRALSSLLAAQAVVNAGAWGSAATACEALANIARDLPDEAMPVRAKSTDAQVLKFIRKRLAENPNLSKTALLREYRSMGNACEQSRFGTIFNQEK
jgi:hypothetical protein